MGGDKAGGAPTPAMVEPGLGIHWLPNPGKRKRPGNQLPEPLGSLALPPREVPLGFPSPQAGRGTRWHSVVQSAAGVGARFITQDPAPTSPGRRRAVLVFETPPRLHSTLFLTPLSRDVMLLSRGMMGES